MFAESCKDQRASVKQFGGILLSCLFFFSFSIFVQKISYFPASIGVDDANIFFVFAKNFCNGKGFVWHVKGGPVEGFTSFLWQIICIVCFYVSDSPEHLIGIICLLIISFSSAVFLKSCFCFMEEKGVSRSNFLKTTAMLCFFIWCLLSEGFLTWNLLALMDTCLWTSFLMLIVASFILNFKKSFLLLLAFLPLVRPEGLVFLLIAFLIYLITEFSLEGCSEICRGKILSLQKAFLGKSGRSVKYLAQGAVLLVPTAALTVFRIVYFGFPLPNTFYAKVGLNLGDQLESGAEYFRSFFLENPIALVVFFLSCVIVVRNLKLSIQSKKSSKILLPAFWFLVGLVLYIVLGGDHFPLHRQYQAFWMLGFPVLICVFKSRLIYLFIFLVVSFFYKLSFAEPSQAMSHQFQISVWGREAGNTLNEIFGSQELPSVATIAIGGVGFAYKGEIIDLMGLTNVKMAHATSVRKGVKNHAAFDTATFYQILPKMVLYFGPDCKKGKKIQKDIFINYVLRNLPQENRFKNSYKTFMVPNQNNPNLPGGICGFIRKDFVGQFMKSGLGEHKQRKIYEIN